LGDHTKAGLGALLNTGTSAGTFCNLLPGGGLLPRHVPSFCSVEGGALREGDFSALLHTAAEVMRRRGRALTEAHRALYRAVFEQTGLARRRALGEGQQRRLRRGAGVGPGVGGATQPEAPASAPAWPLLALRASSLGQLRVLSCFFPDFHCKEGKGRIPRWVESVYIRSACGG